MRYNVYINEDEYGDGEKIPSPGEIAKIVDEYADDVTEIDIKYLKTELVNVSG